MFTWLRSILWDNRNEPLLVLIGAGLLIVVAYQVFVRQLPLVDSSGTILPTPTSKTDSLKVKQLSQVPAGTVVAYFGEKVPLGWVLCDGQNTPQDSPIETDADSSKGGLQIPDLRASFIRGSSYTLDKSPVNKGGDDTISLKHLHLWSYFSSDQWFTHSENNSLERIGNWNEELSNGNGSFGFPSLGRSYMRLYTAEDSVKVSNLPRYVELRFIIKTTDK